jgi:hypothetical protein
MGSDLSLFGFLTGALLVGVLLWREVLVAKHEPGDHLSLLLWILGIVFAAFVVLRIIEEFVA